MLPGIFYQSQPDLEYQKYASWWIKSSRLGFAEEGIITIGSFSGSLITALVCSVDTNIVNIFSFIICQIFKIEFIIYNSEFIVIYAWSNTS